MRKKEIRRTPAAAVDTQKLSPRVTPAVFADAAPANRAARVHAAVPPHPGKPWLCPLPHPGEPLLCSLP